MYCKSISANSPHDYLYERGHSLPAQLLKFTSPPTCKSRTEGGVGCRSNAAFFLFLARFYRVQPRAHARENQARINIMYLIRIKCAHKVLFLLRYFERQKLWLKMCQKRPKKAPPGGLPRGSTCASNYTHAPSKFGFEPPLSLIVNHKGVL
jgi:hypothetical protein